MFYYFLFRVYYYSPYFHKIFVELQSQNNGDSNNPVIVLKDIALWEMNCIMEFMYKGDTSVPEAQLESLMKAADSLKIRGLTTGCNNAEITSDQQNGFQRAR
jgi:hypothetical protein